MKKLKENPILTNGCLGGTGVDSDLGNGSISQIIGPVLDIEFPIGELPRVYDALVILGDKETVTCEVQQLLVIIRFVQFQ
jgi:hypothetical protein